jgi:hypothetical protein
MYAPTMLIIIYIYVLTDSSSYDSHGVFSSPRALFMFRAFGHQRSSVIDGFGFVSFHNIILRTLSHCSGVYLVGKRRDCLWRWVLRLNRRNHIIPPQLSIRARLEVRICLPVTVFLSKASRADYEQIASNSALNPSTTSNAELVLDARSRGR